MFLRRAALLWCWPALAWAGPDFSGHWLLDEGASDSMDAVLKLQDVSWALRQVVGGLDNDVQIAQTTEGMTLTFDNLAGDPVQRLRFDGQPHETVNPGGLATTFTCGWEGEALLCAGPSETDEGVKGTVTERRTLSADGQTMTLLVSVTLPGAGSASAKRVFLRQGG